MALLNRRVRRERREDFRSNHEEHEVNIGSLKCPLGAGRPDGHIGTNGKAPEGANKQAYLCALKGFPFST